MKRNPPSVLNSVEEDPLEWAPRNEADPDAPSSSHRPPSRQTRRRRTEPERRKGKLVVLSHKGSEMLRVCDGPRMNGFRGTINLQDNGRFYEKLCPNGAPMNKVTSAAAGFTWPASSRIIPSPVAEARLIAQGTRREGPSRRPPGRSL